MSIPKKNPREKNVAEVPRRHKPSREQGSGLPRGDEQGGREPEAATAVDIPVVVDVHTATADRETGADVVGERFRTSAPVVLQEVVSGLRQVDEQGRSGDGDGR